MSSDEKKQRSGMAEMRDMLKNEMNKFTNIDLALKETGEDFSKIEKTSSFYGSEIGESSSHIREIRRREFYENLFVYIGFFFYLGCVTYIVLRRFPIHIIIIKLWEFFEIIIFYILQIKGYIDENVLNSKLQNFTYSENYTAPIVNDQSNFSRNNEL
jgi:hypothetical protein